MKNLYNDILKLLEEKRRCAFAAVVRTSGSTPQKPGAQAIFFPEGQLIGTLGGGCLEAEARRVALECIRLNEPRFLEINLNDDFGWDDGLICGGSANIFIEPVVEKSPELFRAILALLDRRDSGVLATVVKAPYRSLMGTRLLIYTNGEYTGDITDVSLRQTIVSQVIEISGENFGKAEHTCIHPSDEIMVYLEPISPRPVLLILGAGHVGQAVARLGGMLDFEVAVADDRPSFANAERFPDVDRIIVDDIAGAVRNFPISKDTYIVIVTRGHRHDAIALRESIDSPASYIGMIGSRRKVLTIFDALMSEGSVTEELLQKVYAPIGLDLGGQSVEEIAVSIAAQLVLLRNKDRRAHPESEDARSLRIVPPLSKFQKGF